MIQQAGGSKQPFDKLRASRAAASYRLYVISYTRE